MAKRKRKAASGRRGKTVASPSFGGRKFACYGKRVKAGRGKKKIARVFCARKDAK